MSEEATKMRVLFVDDEANTLSGLKRMLHERCQEWEMLFVESGDEALQIMSKEQCQIVISDIEMPGMNGVELLEKLQKSYPQTVRVILSGHADRKLIMQCVGTAHQFLAKPCDPETLCAPIKRACAFNTSVKSERIKARRFGTYGIKCHRNANRRNYRHEAGESTDFPRGPHWLLRARCD